MWQYNQNELYHHGVKGQKWYVRQYQNPDGTLTAEGRKRYGASSGEQIFNRGKYAKDASKSLNALDQDRADSESNLKILKKKTDKMNSAGRDASKYEEQMKQYTKNLKAATKAIKSIKADLKEKNYTLTETQTVRLRKKGRLILASIMQEFAPLAAINGTVVMPSGAVYGTKYKVNKK